VESPDFPKAGFHARTVAGVELSNEIFTSLEKVGTIKRPF
jgi:hypothetical protein